MSNRPDQRRWWLSRRFVLTWVVVVIAFILALIFSDPNQPYIYLG